MATPDELHANAVTKMVALKNLHIDPAYQRDISERLVDKIADEWDRIGAELPLLSDRGSRNGSDVRGGLFVVNGQHRTKAAQKKGLLELECRVIDLRKDTNPAKTEAGYRLMTNVRLSDRPLERFKAQLCSGDEESETIVKLLVPFKTAINVVGNPEVGINCVSTIEGIYRQDGTGDALRHTCQVIVDAWGTVDGPRAKADILKAVCWFIEKHADESNRDRLIARMKGLGLPSLESRARTISLSRGGSLWTNYYWALVDLYNEGLREKGRLQHKMKGKTTMGQSRRAV